MDAGSIGKWLSERRAEGAAAGRLAVGTCVGPWRIEAYLGAGRTAEVYRVVQASTGREGALKILSDPALGVRFDAECERMRTFALACVPRFLDAGSQGGRRYYVMEYLLPAVLPLKRAAAARFAAATACAVQELHDAGWVHRDLKPANVLLRRDGTPVLGDLGFAKRYDGASARVPSELSVVDGRPVGVGTLDYAAPEQLLKGVSTPVSDVYALGKILRAAIDGKPGRTLKRIIRKATSDDPADRYPSAAAFACALRGIARRRIVVSAAVLLVVGLVSSVCAPRVAGWLSRIRLRVHGPSVTAVRPTAAVSVTPRISLLAEPGEDEVAYLRRILPAAQAGDSRAQVTVAEAYYHGRGTAVNRAEAVRWYRKAAAKGDPGAEATLGYCALRGIGCKADPDEAFSWLMRGALHGNAGAMSDLAYCFMNGYGTDRNPRAGFEWALKAAKKGHAAAQTLVGECYRDGRGTAADPAEADAWLRRAALQGNARAKKLLGIE